MKSKVLIVLIGCMYQVANGILNKEFFKRPCHFPISTQCVQDFFEEHGGCPRPNSKKVLKRDLQYVHQSICNVTLKQVNTTFVDVDGNITELYINEKTSTLVMVIDFTQKGYAIDVEESYLIFRCVGREPVTTHDRLRARYRWIATVAIKIDNGVLLIDEMIVSAYVTDANLDYVLGDKIFDSKDPQVLAGRDCLLSNVAPGLSETFIKEGLSFIRAYFQRHLCDFNRPLSNTCPNNACQQYR